MSDVIWNVLTVWYVT